MPKIEELQEKKMRLDQESKTLLRKEDYTDVDDKRVDDLLKEVTLLSNQIRGIEKLEVQEAADAKIELENDKRKFEDKKEKKEFRLGEGFTNYVLGREDRSAATQSTTTTAGGYTIPEGWLKNIKEALKEHGGMYENAFKFSTPSGNDMPMPNINDTANKAFKIAESTSPVADSDNAALVFGTQTFKSYKYTSSLIQVPTELFQDSDISPFLESLIVKALQERMWRGMNEAWTTGVGTTDIQGVTVGATDASLTVAAEAITRDNILDLLHSVDPAYRKNGKFMFNDSTLEAIKKLSFGSADNRPLWQPGMAAGAPDTLEGKPYVINQDMADIGASAKSCLFGDFQNYYIREVADWRLVRLVERYAELDQIAFVLWSRWDGQVVDAGTNPIKYFTHAAS